jgi:hypothetical protein
MTGEEWTDESDVQVPLLRCLASITIIEFRVSKDGNMKPDATNGVKSALAAGAMIAKEGTSVSIIRFIKYIVHYMVPFLCTSAYKDGLAYCQG